MKIAQIKELAFGFAIETAEVLLLGGEAVFDCKPV